MWCGWIVTPVVPRSVNDVSFEMRTKYVSLSARRSIWCGWIVTPVVPRTVNDAATKTRENEKAILYVFADCNGCACYV